MNIAVIPARGGSKRIPRKNIKDFHGKPLIAYSIEAAIASGCFDKIIVSTDDYEIAEVALRYGADVPFMRPESISDDFATTMDVMQHAVQWCEDAGIKSDFVCCIYATAPFLLPEYLNEGLSILASSRFKYVFSATSFPFPIQRAIRLGANNQVSMFDPAQLNTRSQDLESAYHDAGQFYWGKVEAFLEGVPIFSDCSTVVLIPRVRVQDIDEMEDWDFAEALYSVLTA